MLLLPQQPSQSICKPFIFGFVSSCCVSRPPRRPHLPTFFPTVISPNPHQISNLIIGRPPAFIHTAATAAEANHHDAHRISQSKPNPEKPHPHAPRLDPQYRLDRHPL